MTTERSDVLPTVPRGDSEELHPREFRFGRCLFWAVGAAASFDIAYGFPQLSFVIVGYLYCLIQLSQGGSGRLAFYFGLAVGLLTAAPQLHCFWSIFGPSAIALWLVVAFWIGLFVALARLCTARFGPRWGLLLIPFLW